MIVTHDVEDAICLADRVLVMEPNPERIRNVFEIDLPRPRDHGDSKVGDLKRRCLAMPV